MKIKLNFPTDLIGADFLGEPPIRKKKVRNGVYAYQYRNGTININGTKYLMHSMTSAINKFRQLNPSRL